MAKEKEQLVVLFDGVCHLCNNAVQFILKREKVGELSFAPLQSEAGQSLLLKYEYPPNYLDGLILIEKNRAHDRSSACIRIARRLKFPWNLFYLLLFVPKPLRDLFYSMVATFRYRWFGKKEHCTLPKGEDSERFLQ